MTHEIDRPSIYRISYDGKEMDADWRNCIDALDAAYIVAACIAETRRATITRDGEFVCEVAAQPQQAESHPASSVRGAALDAVRFRWIEENVLAIDTATDPDGLVQVWHGTDPALVSYGKTLRAAVDAARSRRVC